MPKILNWVKICEIVSRNVHFQLFVIFREISVLLLGTDNAGKTEIGHILSNLPRIECGSTKGVHVFNVNSKSQHIKLTEIGGSDSVRDIWPYYYNDVNENSF